MVPEGGNWRDLPEDIIPIAMGGAYKSGGGKVGFYRRLSYNQPSPTVVTSPVQKATMRLVREFSNSFCRDDGSIDWEKLVEFNSGD